MLFNKTFEAYHAQILSCCDLWVGVWLILRPIFPTFQLPSLVFCTTFCKQLGLSHLSIASILDVCAHIPLTLWVSTFYVVLMVMNALKPMMQFVIPLPPLHKMLVSTWDKNNYMRFLQPHSNLFRDESTLCLPKMTFTPWLTWALLTQHEHIYFPNLAQLKDLLD